MKRKHGAQPVPTVVDSSDLGGHTLEQLSDYLDAGRTPVDPAIEQSPGCLLALSALEDLHNMVPKLVVSDVSAEGETEESWVQSILEGITMDARAGRRIPLSSEAANANLGIIEGAVRSLIRACADSVPGIMVGRCRLNGEVEQPGSPITVEVDVSVPYGQPAGELITALRAEIRTQICSHTEMNLENVDITVRDVHQLPKLDEET